MENQKRRDRSTTTMKSLPLSHYCLNWIDLGWTVACALTLREVLYFASGWLVFQKNLKYYYIYNVYGI